MRNSTRLRHLCLIILLLAAGMAGFAWWGNSSPGRREVLFRPRPSVQQQPAPASSTAEGAATPPGAATAPATAQAIPMWTLGPTQGTALMPKSPAFHLARARGRKPKGLSATIAPESIPPLVLLKQGDRISIPLPGGAQVTGEVNLVQKEAGDILAVAGGIAGSSRSSFTLLSHGKEMGGRIMIREEELAYVISSPQSGQLIVEEAALTDLECLGAAAHPPSGPSNPLQLLEATPTPAWSSRPTAFAVLFLDFDGETVTDRDWNQGNTIVAAASNLNQNQRQEVWRRVSEHYRPFDVDVTTDRGRYDNTLAKHRMRCIITPTDGWYNTGVNPNKGGVAILSSFRNSGVFVTPDYLERHLYICSPTVPCWVFESQLAGPHDIAESAAHELGHTLGLHHDGKDVPGVRHLEYYDFDDTNNRFGYEPGNWAPIMGCSYYKSIAQWSKGEYPYANNHEDQIAIIASPENGFGFAADDLAANLAGTDRTRANPINVQGSAIDQTAIIHGSGDASYYRIDCGGNNVAVNFYATNDILFDNGATVIPSNIYVHMELQDKVGNVIDQADGGGTSSLGGGAAIYRPALSAGTYYLKVQGAAYGDVNTGGFSKYGSIGTCRISGWLPQSYNVYDESTGADIQLTNGTSVNWGATYIGQKITKTFVVQNSGASDLSALSINLDGANAGDFTASTPELEYLASGSGDYTSRYTFTVTFNATTAGAQNAALHIKTTLGGSPSQFDMPLTTTCGSTYAPIFGSPSDVPLSTDSSNVSGLTLGAITLGFRPSPGDKLTLINNTGSGPIQNTFASLPNGGTVALTYQGDTFFFTASYSGGDGNDLVLLLRSAGQLDYAFGQAGLAGTPAISNDYLGLSVATQPDGKIVVAGGTGSAFTGDFLVLRYNTDGSLDHSFNGTGIATKSFSSGPDWAVGVAVQSDGKIVVAGNGNGNTDTSQICVVRYKPDGSVDSQITSGISGARALRMNCMALQSDGKIVVVGNAYFNGSNSDILVVRFNSNGTLDTSFHGTGFVSVDLDPLDVGAGVFVQADHKIIVCGTSLDAGGNYKTIVLRFNGDGSLDTTFNGTGKVKTDLGGPSFGSAVVSLNSDKIVVAGYVNNGGIYRFAVERYNSNGSLDTTWNGTGKLTTLVGPYGDYGLAMAAQIDGKIVVSGYSKFDSISPTYRFMLVRYNQDGSFDTTWNGGGKTITPLDGQSSSLPGMDMVIAADGKIIVAGQTYNGSNYDVVLARYESGLAPDIDVQEGGVSLQDALSEVDWGQCYRGNPVTKVLSVINSGTFTLSGLNITSEVTNKGAVNKGTFSVASFPSSLSPGGADSLLVTFTPGSSSGTRTAGLHIASSVTGDKNPFDLFLSGQSSAIFSATLNSADQAAYDNAATFNTAGLTFGTISLGFQPVAGTTLTLISTHGSGINGTFPNLPNGGTVLIPYNGKNYRFVASYHGGTGGDLMLTCYGPGAPDFTFNGSGRVATSVERWDGQTFESWANAIAVQADGKIMVAGSIAVPFSSDGFVMARYLADGSLDTEFNGTGYLLGGPGPASAIAVQPDGRSVVAGYIASGSFPAYVARYESDGTPDYTFNESGELDIESSGVSSVVLQTDGKILVSGTYSGSSTVDFMLARYNSDGTPDAAFNGGMRVTDLGGNDDYGAGVVVQGDGKIVVAGTSYAATGSFFAAVRYNSNGTLDSTFNGTGKVLVPMGPTATVTSVALQPDGKIVIAGSMSNGVNDDVVAVRLKTNGTLDTTFGISGKVTLAPGHGNDNALSVAVQPNGRIVLSGYSEDDFSFQRMMVVRLAPSGALDSTFNGSGMVMSAVGSGGNTGNALKLQSDGKIIVAGCADFDFPLFGRNIVVMRYVGDAPEIGLSAPDGSVLANSGSPVNFDLVGVGATVSKTFTIRNNGSDNLSQLAVTVEGDGASQFTISGLDSTPVVPGGTTTFVVTFSSSTLGNKNSVIHVSSNDALTSSFDIPLTGVAQYSALQNWRQQWFGTTANNGAAADLADYNRDGIANLTKYALGLNPKAATPAQLPQGRVIGEYFIISFPQPSGVSGVVYGAEYSTTLSGTDWLPVPDSGSGGVHTFSVLTHGNDRIFMRLRVSTE